LRDEHDNRAATADDIGPFPLQEICGLPGFICNWLLRGPLRTRPDWADSRLGGLQPEPGRKTGRWQHFRIEEGFALCPGKIYNISNVFAYACCYLACRKTTRAILEVGSFSGYRLWVNGQEMGNPVTPGDYKIGDNCYEVTLRDGANFIMVEIQPAASEGFCVRVYRPDRSALTGVTVFTSEPGPRLREQPQPPRRKFKVFEYFNELLSSRPAMAFDARTRDEWRRWRGDLRAKLRELLGMPDATCPLATELVEERDLGDHIRQKIVIDSEPNASVPCYVLIPKEPVRRERRPGLLCLHGHGEGKGRVVGADLDGEPEPEGSDPTGHDYGRAYVRRGYVTITPDFRCFGERRSSAGPNSNKDVCDAFFMRAALFGRNIQGLDQFDLQRVLDYFCGREEVDPDRLGAVGLSYGGRTTTFLAALDDRIKACVISGALNTYKERFGLGRSCGSQMVPGMILYGDIPEVMSLIAPRPLLLELGTNDGTSPEIFATDAYERIRKVYDFLGAEDRLDIDIFDSGHKFNGRKSLTWFDRWL